MKKRFFSLLLACILCLSMFGTVFAQGDDWSPEDWGPNSGGASDGSDNNKDDNDNKDDDNKDDDNNHNNGNNGGNTPVVDPTPAPSDTSEGDTTSRKPSSGGGEEKGPEIKFKTGENGTITISPTDPKKGDTVTITPTPKEGYIVGSITVTTNSGKNVMLMNLGSKGYSFTMPGEKITIATTWRELNPTPAAPQATFSDVPATEWFATAIAYVSQNGIMAGNNGNFSPNERLTRGMMAQILYNMEKASATGTASFPDVPATEWYAASAAWASSKGFMSGYSNGNFGPNDPITREQLATILHRYATVKSYDTTPTADISTFSDGAATSDWSAQAVRWAVGSGLLSGKTGVGGSRLDPTGTATRAEVAQILMNNATKIANKPEKDTDKTDVDANKADQDADKTDEDADKADEDENKTDKGEDKTDEDEDKTE